MKKTTKLLRDRAINSLIHAIDHFNRPYDRGRIEAVLIFLDHSFEMLLKSAIVHRGGKIRDKGAKQTIGFDACVRRSLTDANIKFLEAEQALTLQNINGLRDAAQHHIVDLSEGQLYIHAQAGLTLFRDLYSGVFESDLTVELPERVLPVSTTPPTDLAVMFDHEVDEVRQILEPGRRKRVEARAKLRGWAILESSIAGEYTQPSSMELDKLCNRIRDGENWRNVFPGVASITVIPEGDGPNVNLRFTKREGIPIHVAQEGEGGGAAVAIRRVNELDFYNLGLQQMAGRLDISRMKLWAIIQDLEVQENQEFFKEFRIGSQRYKRYSQKALQFLSERVPNLDIAEIWNRRRPRRRIGR